MRVLYSMIYAPEKGGSGAPIYTHHLLKGISEVDEKPGIVFSAHHSYQNPSPDFYESLPIYFDRPAIFDNQPKVANSIAFKDMTEAQINENIDGFYNKFKECITQKNYDLMHVQHGMYIGYAASKIKEEFGTPYTITLHIMELNFIHEFPDPVLAMKAMVDANYIIAITAAQKQRLLDEYTKERIIDLESKNKGISKEEAEERYLEIIGDREINPDQIIVCHLGIDTDFYDLIDDPEVPQEIKDLNIPEGSKLVMFAGRLIDMKGVKHLLDAEMVYNPDNSIHTIILGGGELEEYTEKIADKRSNVHFLGFLEQERMPAFHNYTASRDGVFCVPSSSEGCSLVYLEAMAAGTRVVGCSKKDMGDMDFMQPPFAAFVEFGDADALANKITEFLNEENIDRPVIRKRMEAYNIPNMVEAVRKVYDMC